MLSKQHGIQFACRILQAQLHAKLHGAICNIHNAELRKSSLQIFKCPVPVLYCSNTCYLGPASCKTP